MTALNLIASIASILSLILSVVALGKVIRIERHFTIDARVNASQKVTAGAVKQSTITQRS